MAAHRRMLGLARLAGLLISGAAAAQPALPVVDESRLLGDVDRYVAEGFALAPDLPLEPALRDEAAAQAQAHRERMRGVAWR